MIGHYKWQEALQNLAKKNDLGHGVIFFGPEGVGKKTFAISLANFLEHGDFSESSGLCTDLKLVEPVGKTLGIDEAREVRGWLSQTPLNSPRRTVIINNAHQLTTQAQNALLKTIEEPPKHSFIILVARDHDLLLPTLASRLPKMYFGRLRVKEVAAWLEDKGVESREAAQFALLSRGSPGLAWRYAFDESTQKIYKTAKALLVGTTATQASLVKEMVTVDDFDMLKILDALIVLSRDMSSREKRFMQTALTMRREAATFNVNPRLQLEYLLSQSR